VTSEPADRFAWHRFASRPDPVRVATEGALWGAIADHGFLHEAVIVSGLIWWFYADLKAYRAAPTSRRRSEMRARFDRIFLRTTGFATLDRLLQRLHANKTELLMVLDHPEIPLHTNGSENDIRCQVTKRQVSGGTKTDIGRDCRNAFLGLGKTCRKLGVSFWNYLGDRLSVAGAPAVPRLANLIQWCGQHV
jgi:hypothetical protein